jgi:drug/metabolite transporter (DMT)-like permease
MSVEELLHPLAALDAEALAAPVWLHTADALACLAAGLATAEGASLAAFYGEERVAGRAAVIRHTEADAIHVPTCLTPAAIAVPVALATDSWMPVPQVWSAADRVVPVIALLHAGAYTGYVWLVGRAGSVFASQVAYVVTAMGVLWSMLLLAESYALWVWVAFALMLAGVAMVRPRDAQMREAA